MLTADHYQSRMAPDGVVRRGIIFSLLFTPGYGGRWGLPVIFIGPPGGGKTSITGAETRAAHLIDETVLASIRQPDDFLGMPIPVSGEAEVAEVLGWMREAEPSVDASVERSATGKAQRMVLRKRGARRLRGQRIVAYAPPRWALRLHARRRGVAFFDEVNLAPRAVMAALLRVILEGVVGDLRLGPGVRFLAAMNAVDDSAGGMDLPAPLANRFGHLPWPAPTVAGWLGYMSGCRHADMRRPAPEKGAFRPRDEEARVAAAWPAAYARALAEVGGFLAARGGEALHRLPAADDPARSGAWPSPRTCEMATLALAGARLHGQSVEVQDAIVAAFVGDPWTKEYAEWRLKADLPDPVALLDGTLATPWAHDPRRLDRSHAVLSACSSLVVGTTEADLRAKRTDACWRLFHGVAQAGAIDLTVKPATTLLQARPRLSTATKAARDALDAIHPAIGALTAVRNRVGRRGA